MSCWIYLTTLLKAVTYAFNDYCSNSSIVGVKYILNRQYHFVESLFWILCIATTGYFSYSIILTYYETFQSQAFSLVIESMAKDEKIEFPSVGVCQYGNKHIEYEKAIQLAHEIAEQKNLEKDSKEADDIIDFVIIQTFPNLYRSTWVFPYCGDDPKKSACPPGNFTSYADFLRENCTSLFDGCSWDGNKFNCCEYFLPLRTTQGLCFVANSKQTTGGPKLKAFISPYETFPILEINVTEDASINILNEADVPHSILRNNKIEIITEKYKRGSFKKIEVLVNKQIMINDDGIQDILPEYRKCRFGYETLNGSLYRLYSYSACITDCIREIEDNLCNCSDHNFSDKHCDLQGYMCLDKHNLFKPSPGVLIPWSADGFECDCLPSCEDHELIDVGAIHNYREGLRSHQVTITLSTFPTEKYRRQLLRDQLYMVVTFGGIFGLFMGASIVSLIELVYFLVTRFVWYLFFNKP